LEQCEVMKVSFQLEKSHERHINIQTDQLGTILGKNVSNTRHRRQTQETYS
jgi:hypothetical protein